VKRAFWRNQISVCHSGRSALLAAAIMGCCVVIHAAEIHEAAELGDLERVKAYLSQDPKQIDLVDAKGRTVLACAARSGKQEVVEFLLANGAKGDIYAAAIVGDVDKVAAFLKQDRSWSTPGTAVAGQLCIGRRFTVKQK
jgi:ankyrin repeat protein